MKYPYFRGLEADRYSFYRVPKALIKVDLFEKMSGDAKLLYAVLLDRMNLSLKNGWQDEDGNAYIICTIDEFDSMCQTKGGQTAGRAGTRISAYRAAQAGLGKAEPAVCERPLCGTFTIELLEV